MCDRPVAMISNEFRKRFYAHFRISREDATEKQDHDNAYTDENGIIQIPVTH